MRRLEEGPQGSTVDLSRPSTPLRASVKVVSGIAIVRAEDGSVAVVPEDELCSLAERLNIVLEGYKC
ncbi:MAG: hypothetical protein ABWW70_08090 [Thermoproteota archaeon]